MISLWRSATVGVPGVYVNDAGDAPVLVGRRRAHDREWLPEEHAQRDHRCGDEQKDPERSFHAMGEAVDIF